MIRILCIIAMWLAWLPVSAAVGVDSLWVKVPVAAVDSVWVKVPVQPSGASVVIRDTVRITEEVIDTAPAEGVDMATVPLMPVKVSPWSRKHQVDPARVTFAWGAEVGSSIDMSENDMSSVDFNATFGLRYKWINFAGVGAGADIMVSNSCRTYPVFAVFRTDFSSQVNFVFLDVRGGAALNYLPGNVNQTDAYASVSIGFVLSTGKSYRSYITAGYTYIGRKDVEQGERITEYSPLQMASIRLGITF